MCDIGTAVADDPNQGGKKEPPEQKVQVPRKAGDGEE